MTPGSFDAATCRELVGDEQARNIEAKGRAAADRDDAPPAEPPLAATYWGDVQAWARYVVEVEAYERRRARLARMSNPPTAKGTPHAQ